MEALNITACNLLANALQYPNPQLLSRLERDVQALPAGGQRLSVTAFLNKICRLSLGEWEELQTRTLDLNPPAAPYIGYQTWGESYQRGAFLAKMARVLHETGVNMEGELPDHLAVILRYLAQAESPLPELLEVFSPAVKRMLMALRAADPDNPYVDLMEAVHALAIHLNKEAV